MAGRGWLERRVCRLRVLQNVVGLRWRLRWDSGRPGEERVPKPQPLALAGLSCVGKGGTQNPLRNASFDFPVLMAAPAVRVCRGPQLSSHQSPAHSL